MVAAAAGSGGQTESNDGAGGVPACSTEALAERGHGGSVPGGMLSPARGRRTASRTGITTSHRAYAVKRAADVAIPGGNQSGAVVDTTTGVQLVDPLVLADAHGSHDAGSSDDGDPSIDDENGTRDARKRQRRRTNNSSLTSDDGGVITCRYCPHTSESPGAMVRHERTHTGAKPFACVHCQYTSSRSDDLAKHVRARGRCGAVASGWVAETLDRQRGTAEWAVG